MKLIQRVGGVVVLSLIKLNSHCIFRLNTVNICSCSLENQCMETVCNSCVLPKTPDDCAYYGISGAW